MLLSRAAAVAALLILLSLPATAATFQVDTLDDVPDANPGDGVCAAASGDCSLRAAVEEANALPGRDEVRLPGGVLPLAGIQVRETLDVRGVGAEDSVVALAGTLLLESSPGPGSAGGTFTDLQIRGGLIRCDDGRCDFERVRITGGQGIRCEFQQMTFTDVIFDHNTGPLGCFDGGIELRGSRIEDNDTVGIDASDTELLVVDSQILRNGGAGVVSGEAGLRFERSVIADNGGAGIDATYLSGIDLIDSLVKGNQDGGIRVATFSFRVVRSAIVDNVRESGCGGGIFAGGAQDSVLVASTVSGNRAPVGGGICLAYRPDLEAEVAPWLHVLGSTITDNRADEGGGVAVLPSPPAYPFDLPEITLEESILARNEADAAPDCSASMLVDGDGLLRPSAVSDGWNVLGVVDGCEIDLQPSDQAGNAATPLDPGLSELGDHGGPTPTHALLEGSPALEAVPVDACGESDFFFPFLDLAALNATDQRGVARPQGPACDVGAFERERPLEVEIDVRPYQRWNVVNTRSRGLLPVGLLGSGDLDVSEVELATLRFGPGGAPAVFVWPWRLDLDRDGRADLLALFRTPATGIEPGDEEACLGGGTGDGRAFEGCDAIRTVPPRRPPLHRHPR